MINIENYTKKLIDLLKDNFTSRFLYLGLQGSYLRNEATENSDVDIMVIIDDLSVSDLKLYRSLIESLGDFDKSCGFICSKNDLINWNPLEICNLINSTKDYYGKLCDFTPSYNSDDVKNFIKFSLNNIYHEICHRYIHGNSENNVNNLPFTYKGVFFILQNLHYLKTGRFKKTKAELLKELENKDKLILEKSIEINKSSEYNFEESFNLIFTWCQETLSSL